MIIRMIYMMFLSLVMIISGCAMSPTASNAPSAAAKPTREVATGNSEYKLSSGDVISISVFGERDLSVKEQRLDDAGTFSYPFLGLVEAKGKTPVQIEQLLTERLKAGYLVNPRVSVSVIEYRSFFIGGEVKTPGGYPFQPGLTVRRAVALAGGFTERASENSITIIRDPKSENSDEKVSLDDKIMPGDTITVPQGFF